MNRGESCGFSLAKEMTRSLHLERFRFMSFSAHQPSVRSMTDCRLSWLPLLIISDEDVSSTYFRLRSWLEAKSLIIMRNNIGPSTFARGTPPLTDSHSLDSSGEEVDHPIYDEFINAKLTLFCYMHFAKVKKMQKNAEKCAEFSITIDVELPGVEHINEGIDGGIPFL